MAFKFQGFDFLHLDASFTEDELLVRRTARDFVEDNIIPIIEDCFREGRFPRELVPLMGELGFYGANLEGYGCAGMSNVEYGLVMQELERGDSGLRSFVSVQSALVMYPIFTFGSEEQKKTWLPALATGEKLGCFGLTEPGFGSNPGGHDDARPQIRRRVHPQRRKDVDHLGHDRRCGHRLGQARGQDETIPEDETAPKACAAFSSKPTGPASPPATSTANGRLRASVTSSLTLEDVHVPEANLLPGATGLKSALMCLNQARYGISWGAIGAAMDCYSTALNYAKTRKQFHNQPIASHQLVQEKLVWMASEISKAQLLSLHVGRLKDAGTAGHQHISMAKRNNVWMALECARLARDILGANGVTEDYPIMRHIDEPRVGEDLRGHARHPHADPGPEPTGIGAY